jgi:hypothetical protein
MPSLSLNVGLNNGRKLPFAGGGGAGFPDVASTNQIAVTSVTGTMFGVANNGIGTYTKNGPINPNTSVGVIYYVIDAGGDPSAAITFNNGQWELNYNDDGSQTHSINLSSDPTTIPTTGWVLPITITAA